MRAFPFIATSVLALGVAGVTPAAAQDSKWALDLSAGLAAPSSEVQGDDLGTGLGFEGAFSYQLRQHLFAYAGWDWRRFAPDESFAGSDVDFEETGYAFGLRFDHPFGGEEGDGATYRIRAGATLNHVELEDADGELISDSGHGLGWEVGAGVTLPLGGRWRLVPEARFRATDREVEVGASTFDVPLHYFSFDLGFSRSF